MSMFGMGLGRPQSDYDENKINAIKGEMLMVSAMKDKMTNICYEKCVPPHYSENDLNKGESNCVDRCAAKFFETIKIVGSELQKQAAQQ
ncbi:Tim10/DDP family zinc finger-domain-containing protein [Kockiozyma suomiensis]|uniref:Tim10/DDP family zinc finger-domain-containing protein n=1 Tax=Kockiozyma suomiensis TaxID=1337062 RepID=UPI0033443539